MISRRKPRGAVIRRPAWDDDTRPIVRVPHTEVRTFPIVPVRYGQAPPWAPPAPPRPQPVIPRAVAETLSYLIAETYALDRAGLGHCAGDAAADRRMNGVLPHWDPAWDSAQHPAWIIGRAAAEILRGRPPAGDSR